MSRRWATALLVVVLVISAAFFAQSRGERGQTRTYFIAADEVDWDYAPSGRNLISNQEFTEEEQQFAAVGPHRIGRKIKKAIFREYTDSTFTQLKPRPPQWEHLGIFGPLVRAVVGDTIRIVFKNNTKFAATMHPHGVIYNKDSEGAPYEDGTSGKDKADDGVPTGGMHTYIWPVPERAGPTEHEGSTSFWMYHSHAHEVRDVNSGLIGPMIITRRGMANADATPSDVDREIVASLLEFDENSSWYVEENVRQYATKPDEVKFIKGPFGNLVTAPDFGSYFKETINGLFYGNTPALTMTVGEKVRWYVMANTNFEIHAPHWHGNVVTINHMRTDVTSLLPMSMLVADMEPDNVGTWFFHCHVADHLRMGMQAVFTVQPRQLAAR